MRQLLRRLRYVVRRRQREAELVEELDFHREMAQHERQSAGVAPADAALAATRAFGSSTLTRNRVNDVWLWPWLQDAIHDARFAVRLLFKHYWFTVLALSALGLTMAMATVVLTFVNALVLRGLPFIEPERVMVIGTRDARQREAGMSFLDYRDWRSATTAFSDIAAFGGAGINVGDPGQPSEQFTGLYVSANTFQLLGVQPVLGRDFSGEDDRPGALAVIMLANTVWKSRYASDASIIGRSVSANSSLKSSESHSR